MCSQDRWDADIAVRKPCRAYNLLPQISCRISFGKFEELGRLGSEPEYVRSAHSIGNFARLHSFESRTPIFRKLPQNSPGNHRHLSFRRYFPPVISNERTRRDPSSGPARNAVFRLPYRRSDWNA
jgi:hypothetical protein